MSKGVLAQLSLSKYPRLLSTLAGVRNATTAVCSLDGAAISVSEERHRRTIESRLSAWADAALERGVPGRGDHGSVSVGDGATLHLRMLIGDHDTPFGWIAMLVPRRGPGSNRPDDATIHRALSIGSECLQDEYRLSIELDEMADELGARYDELNLVYGLDEKSASFELGDAPGAFAQLVEDAAAHLSIDATVCYVPEESVEIERNTEGDRVVAFVERCRWRKWRDELLALVATQDGSIVLNARADAAVLGFRMQHSMRLAAAAIRDVQSRVSGVLAIMRDGREPKFTTGDRRLLEVLAERACAVLQQGYDRLTGLPNRQSFEHRMSAAIGHCNAGALLYIDLDQLQQMNDTGGYVAGDELLKRVAALVRSRTRGGDVVARLGGDEFGVFLVDCPLPSARGVADELLESIRSQRFAWQGKSFTITASIGVTAFQSEAPNGVELLVAADAACLMAKRRGGNRSHVHDPLSVECPEPGAPVHWVSRINRALAQEYFCLYAQPRVRLAAPGPGAELHAEMSLRLLEGDGEPIAPFAFLPAAERHHLMPAVDRWVIRKALAILEGHREVLDRHRVTIAIHVSGQTLEDDTLGDDVCRDVVNAGIPFDWLCFEITETEAMANLGRVFEFVSSLRRRGCRFALDDFGSGFSSLSYLSSLPVDFLKIDGSRVKNMTNDPLDEAIVRSVQSIASVLGLHTIADCGQAEEVLDKLGEIGVDFAQGRGTGEPVPFAQLLSKLGPGAPRAVAG